ncbi:MAG: DUF4783 domain-containing protein [Bacteroidales bacterium]|nr:DUF4783 domain-containing protein [Bacteroidales bacterium]MBN2757351.1 DUF4783 domain-containing protein [Bacteroidales bacterium]
MRSKKIYFFIVIILHFFINTSVFSQEVLPKEVKNAVASGSSKELAVFFNVNIELFLLNKEDVYSKAQAQLIVKDFFHKNKPHSFIIIQEGKSADSNYAICNLETSVNNFRVYISYKKIKGKALINQLNISEYNK